MHRKGHAHMQFPRWQRTAGLLSALFYSQKCQSSQKGPQGSGKILVYLSQMMLHLEIKKKSVKRQIHKIH